jgi:hypothetical protein
VPARHANSIRSPRPRSAGRWLIADARDVTFIGDARPKAGASVPTVSAGIARWQRTIGRRRMVALLRRSLIVGLAAACILQLAAIVSGTSGPGVWLVAALVPALLSLLPGLLHRTKPATAARMLDRDLELGAGVTTALELERGTQTQGLGALAISDGREALARSLAGSRVRLRPKRSERVLLGTLLAGLIVLCLLPALGGGGSGPATTAQGRTGAHRGVSARGGSNDPTRQQAGPDLRAYAHDDGASPSLSGLSPGGTQKGGVASKNNPYGGGTGTHGPSSAVQPASRTVGNAGYLQNTHTSSSAQPKSASEGAAGARGKTTLTTHEAAAAGAVKSGSPVRAQVPQGQQAAKGAAGTAGVPGHASTQGGTTRGGAGSSAVGNSSQSGTPGQGTPGGATAGGTRGSQNAANGVVPQLGGSKSLPIQPGYEAVKGTKGGKGEGASSANGAGGASHSGQASAATSSSTAAGVAYVPPGGSSITPSERRLLIGYFGSFARVTAAGW